MRETRNRITKIQLETLVHFMRDNPSRLDKENKWIELVKILNNKGNSKTIGKWRKTWQDHKCAVQKKITDSKSDPGKNIQFNELELETKKIIMSSSKSKLLKNNNIKNSDANITGLKSQVSNSITTDNGDFDEEIEKSTKQGSPDTINLEIKEEIIDNELISIISGNERLELDDIELPSQLDDDDIFYDDENSEEEIESISENCFDLNLNKTKLVTSKYNNNLKEVCDLLIVNSKDFLEVKQEKIFINKASATIEKRRIELEERKLKLLLKQMKLKKRKLEIELKMLEETNIEKK